MKNEKKAIDLGLPSGLLWATCNVGANSPEDYGDYYAWGETKTKSEYSSDNYTHRRSIIHRFTKYNIDSDYGNVDNLTTLTASDDAATANYGDKWRTPTAEEWQELRGDCEWTWIDNYNNTGVAGYEVKGSNGNSIFLPAAGGRNNDNLYDAGSYGYYWSSSLCSVFPGYAWGVYFGSGYVYRDNNFRCCGQSVRPVCE